MMLKKLELHVDRLIQQVLDRFRNWRLFGIAAMLSHLERGSFLGDALSRITGEEPLLCFESQLNLNIDRHWSLLAVGLLKLAEAITGDGASILMRLSQGSIFLLCLCAALGTVGFYSVEILGLSGGLSLLGYGLLASSMILILTPTIKLGEAYAMVWCAQFLRLL
jgi:hypothetical protein